MLLLFCAIGIYVISSLIFLVFSFPHFCTAIQDIFLLCKELPLIFCKSKSARNKFSKLHFSLILLLVSIILYCQVFLVCLVEQGINTLNMLLFLLIPLISVLPLFFSGTQLSETLTVLVPPWYFDQIECKISSYFSCP